MTFIDDTILKGAIDLHVHVGPDYSPPLECAQSSSKSTWLQLSGKRMRLPRWFRRYPFSAASL